MSTHTLMCVGFQIEHDMSWKTKKGICYFFFWLSGLIVSASEKRVHFSVIQIFRNCILCSPLPEKFNFYFEFPKLKKKASSHETWWYGLECVKKNQYEKNKKTQPGWIHFQFFITLKKEQ